MMVVGESWFQAVSRQIELDPYNMHINDDYILFFDMYLSYLI